MRNKRGLSNILSIDRKTLYIVLGIIMVSVLTLTVVYAALSTTLNINGNAEVSAASWDIHLDNVQLNNQSVTSIAPTITNSTTATFSTTLSKPGDFYEFTIDVVNNGSIDAMIDSVTKIPELSTTQAKYLNYIVEYQNGESITKKQLVSKKSFVRIKVKVEFRKDITASDLPTTPETLDLSFTVNYVQSDGIGNNVTNNGIALGFPIEWNSKNILENHSIMVNNMLLNGAIIKVSDFAPSFDEVSNSQMTFYLNDDEAYINETVPIKMDNTTQQNYLSYGSVTIFRYEHSIDVISSLFFISVSDINDTGNMVEEIGEIPFQEPGLYVSNNINDYSFEELPSFDVIIDKIN